MYPHKMFSEFLENPTIANLNKFLVSLGFKPNELDCAGFYTSEGKVRWMYRFRNGKRSEKQTIFIKMKGGTEYRLYRVSNFSNSDEIYKKCEMLGLKEEIIDYDYNPCIVIPANW